MRRLQMIPTPYLTASLVILFSCAPVAAQHALFSGMAFEHEVTPRYGYQLEVEHRQIIATGDENRTLLQAALNFLLSDRLSITPAVRVTPDYGQGPTTVRLQADVNYRIPLGESPFLIEGRWRTQYQQLVSREKNEAYEMAVRPRVGLAWAVLAHSELALEYEARYRFDRRKEFSRHRVTLGVSQEISTRISTEAFYRLERRANVDDPITEPTIGVYLVYVLPDGRKRDWKYRRPFGRSLLW